MTTYILGGFTIEGKLGTVPSNFDRIKKPFQLSFVRTNNEQPSALASMANRSRPSFFPYLSGGIRVRGPKTYAQAKRADCSSARGPPCVFRKSAFSPTSKQDEVLGSHASIPIPRFGVRTRDARKRIKAVAIPARPPYMLLLSMRSMTRSHLSSKESDSGRSVGAILVPLKSDFPWERGRGEDGETGNPSSIYDNAGVGPSGRQQVSL